MFTDPTELKAIEGGDTVLSPIAAQKDQHCTEQIWFKYLSKDNCRSVN